MSDRHLIELGSLTEAEMNEMANDDLRRRVGPRTFAVLDGELVRNDGPLPSILMWCAEHSEPVWMYTDGSFSCPRQSLRHDVRSFPYEMKEPLL